MVNVFLKSVVTSTDTDAMLVFISIKLKFLYAAFLQAIEKRCRYLGVILDELSEPASHAQEPPHLLSIARLGKLLYRLYFCIVGTVASSTNHISKVSGLA